MCSIDWCDEWSTVWLVDYLTARTPKRCYECRRTISPREDYQRVKSLYDGRWDTWAICQHCTVVAEWLEEMCGGYLHGGLLEELEEHWGEGYRRAEFGYLINGVKRQWRDGTEPVPDVFAVWSMARRMGREKVGAR